MKTLVLAFLCLFTAGFALAQSTTVDAEVTLVAPGASCTFTLSSDLDFGAAERPATESGSVTINAVTGTRTSSGTVVSGTSTVGQVRLVGQHVSNYTVSRTFPSSLTRSTESLTFEGAWAQSANANNSYVAINTSTYSGTSSGAGSNFTRYFRFGGKVSGITWGDSDGDYTGSISTSASCN